MVFIDALRLLAAFQMVQGHTVDAVLDTQLRAGWMFEVWQSARGLTAVSFLFAAGLAFQQTTLLRLTTYRANPALSVRRVRRGCGLIALGYLLHLPLALAWTTDAPSRARIVADFLSVDVLQCIGVTLLALELLVRLLPSAGWIALGSTLLGAALFAGSVEAQQLAVSGPWFGLLAYVSPRAGSIFPLLPWAGHFALAVGLAHWAQHQWRTRLLVAALLLSLAGGLLRVWPAWELVSMHLLRVAAVAGVCAVLAWLLRSRERLAPWLERLAGETLAVYVFHILLVYGAGAGLSSWIGPRLSLSAAIVVTALVMGVSAVVALGLGGFWARPGLAAPARKR